MFLNIALTIGSITPCEEQPQVAECPGCISCRGEGIAQLLNVIFNDWESIY